MIRTIFAEFVDKYFRAVVGAITEKFNGKATENELLHKTMLREEYSTDLTWGATELNHSVVAADVVSLDSSLPLKKRGSMKVATGNLPKLGMKYFKGEKDISDINIMIARGTDEATIATKLFDDASNAIKGVDIRTEVMFLQGLSTGMILVTDEDNVGVGIRVSFGYKEKNTFHATTAKWGESDATPIDDIQQLFDKATYDGNVINHVWLSKKYFNFARNSDQGKQLAATSANMVITDKSLIPVPSPQVFLNALQDEFGAEFHIINSTFKAEGKDGKHIPINAWEQANIIGTPSNIVGRLVYGTLAEETNPVQNVVYTKSGTHILVSKYSTTDPLKEFTASQALCLPVIDGADSIYILHADAVEKSALEVDPSELSFAARAQTKKASIHYDGKVSDLSVECDAEWAEVAITGDKKVSVKVVANDTEADRSTEATISDGTNNVTLTITQKA